MSQMNTGVAAIIIAVVAILISVAGYGYLTFQNMTLESSLDDELAMMEAEIEKLQADEEDSAEAISACQTDVEALKEAEDSDTVDETDATDDDASSADDDTADEAPDDSDDESAVADPYAGWSTFTDTKYGVTWRYPGGWTAQENTIDSSVESVFDKDGFCVAFEASEVFLEVCYREASDSTMGTWFRTGMGYGELRTEATSVTMDGTTITERRIHGEGSKISDVFWGTNATDAADEPGVNMRVGVGPYIVTAQGSATYALDSGPGITDADIDTMEKILESIAL